jgi:hypothetical protein
MSHFRQLPRFLAELAAEFRTVNSSNSEKVPL